MTTDISRYAEIKQAALNVLEANRIDEPPVTAARLAEAYGFTVIGMIFSPEHAKRIAGFIDVPSGEIVVNAEDAPVIQNYTIAHELGHYLLKHHEAEDFEKNYSVLLREAGGPSQEPMEIEANLFADNLLVPSMFLREYLDRYPRATNQELSNIFGVSPEVIRYRRPYA